MLGRGSSISLIETLKGKEEGKDLPCLKLLCKLIHLFHPPPPKFTLVDYFTDVPSSVSPN